MIAGGCFDPPLAGALEENTVDLVFSRSGEPILDRHYSGSAARLARRRAMARW